MSHTPYQKKNPGDVLRLQDWHEVQLRIKEELRNHEHLGSEADGEQDPRRVGPLLDADAFADGTIETRCFKTKGGAVGHAALADGAVVGRHFDPQQRFSERAFRFVPDAGHDHDGIRSRGLPPAAVGSTQIANGSVNELHLLGAPANVHKQGDGDGEFEPIGSEEETYAIGEGDTPGNLLRAVRDLVSHLGLRQRPLLDHRQTYALILGRRRVLTGFALDRLPTDVRLELLRQDEHFEQPVSIQVLSERSVGFEVPDMGLSALTGTLRLVRGAGTAQSPLIPLTNTAPFHYSPRPPDGEVP